eukprot:11381605-Alexandrium_andersonii.AAC.1
MATTSAPTAAALGAPVSSTAGQLFILADGLDTVTVRAKAGGALATEDRPAVPNVVADIFGQGAFAAV